eukprot:jgi/Ulvmu1/9063/UM005_0156.1
MQPPSERGGFLRSKKGNQRGDQGGPQAGQGFPVPPGPLRGPPGMGPMQPWGAQQLRGMPGPPHLDRQAQMRNMPPMQAPGHGRPFQPRPPAARPSGSFQNKPAMAGVPRALAQAATAPARPPRATATAERAQQVQPRPAARSASPAPRGSATAGTAFKASGPEFREFADVSVSAAAMARVSYLDRMRAMNALAGIGNAAKAEHTAAAIKAAAAAFRSGDAFKASVFADDVTEFVPGSVAAAAEDLTDA